MYIIFFRRKGAGMVFSEKRKVRRDVELIAGFRTSIEQSRAVGCRNISWAAGFAAHNAANWQLSATWFDFSPHPVGLIRTIPSLNKKLIRPIIFGSAAEAPSRRARYKGQRGRWVLCLGTNHQMDYYSHTWKRMWQCKARPQDWILPK